MEYRRARVDGGTFFFTVVTHSRRPILTSPTARGFLRMAFREVRRRHPFWLEGIVLLPDHLHMLMRLPEGDADYPVRVGGIKRHFTSAYLPAGGREAAATTGQVRKRLRAVWQGRFWEHTIRDARDFRMHLDYVHLNPVKHGLVANPSEWPWTSFHRYVRMGWYEADWSGRVELPGQVEYYEP